MVRTRFGELITCSICGKPFIKSACSIYKVVYEHKTYHQCSWGCYNKALLVKDTKGDCEYQLKRNTKEIAK